MANPFEEALGKLKDKMDKPRRGRPTTKPKNEHQTTIMLANEQRDAILQVREELSARMGFQVSLPHTVMFLIKHYRDHG